MMSRCVRAYMGALRLGGASSALSRQRCDSLHGTHRPLLSLARASLGHATDRNTRPPIGSELQDKFKQLKIKEVLVLEKITKYDLERKNGLTDSEIRERFPLAYRTHRTHLGIMDALMRLLKERYRLRTIAVKAQSHNLVLSDLERSGFSLDLIISAGGDGTFLEAAALLPPSQTSLQRPWIVGLNTDPERSVGAMCMSYFKRGGMVFRRYSGEQRTEPDDSPKQNMIRFTESDALVRKECASDTISEKEWNNLAKASFCDTHHDGNDTRDHCTVISKHIANIYNITYDDYVGSLLERLIVNRDYVPVARQKIRIKMFKRQSAAEQEIVATKGDSTFIEDNLFCGTESSFTEDDLDAEACASGDGVIPYGAVNDVIIADKNFGKTFYGLVQVDALPIIRVKSSGVLVSTGTGSTAWAYNMCKMSMGNGFRLLNHLINHRSFPKEAAKVIDAKMMREAVEEHNAGLVFDASQSTLKCIIRESISDTSTVDATSFMGRQVKLLSLSKNARLVIDGSRIMKVDYGDVVVLKTFESDTIWSCV